MKNQSHASTDAAVKFLRRPWTTPTTTIARVSQAENGLTNATQDGSYNFGPAGVLHTFS